MRQAPLWMLVYLLMWHLAPGLKDDMRDCAHLALSRKLELLCRLIRIQEISYCRCGGDLQEALPT